MIGSRCLQTRLWIRADHLSKITLPCQFGLNLASLPLRTLSTTAKIEDAERRFGSSKFPVLIWAGAGIVTGLAFTGALNSDKMHEKTLNDILTEETFVNATDVDARKSGSKHLLIVMFENLKNKWLKEKYVDCAGNDAGCVKEDKCEDSCFHKMDKEEECIEKANSALEKSLKESKPAAIAATENAIKSYCAAVDSIKAYIDKAYCAVEEENLRSPRFEEVWCAVRDAVNNRNAKVKEACEKGQAAWELLCALREIIERGKADKYTSCNPLLVTAEETLQCAETEIVNTKGLMECRYTESKLIEKYETLVEEFRQNLKAEMDILLTTDPCCSAHLTESEINMILTHAYKKILSIQKEISMLQKGDSGSKCGEESNCDKCRDKKSNSCDNGQETTLPLTVVINCNSCDQKCK